MHHAINACKRRAATLVAMRVELLLGQNIAAGLVDETEKKEKREKSVRVAPTDQRDPVIPTHLA